MKAVRDDLLAWGLLTLGVSLIALEGFAPEPRWWLYAINACTVFVAAHTLQIKAQTRALLKWRAMLEAR